MQEVFNVVDNIHYIGQWLILNRIMLLQYIINITSALIITIVGCFLSTVISNTLNKILTTRRIDKTISDFSTTISKYFIITFTMVIALSRVGVQTTSVIAILGAAGMTVGLALQGSLSNFAAGVLLVVFSPLRIGEYVVLKKVAGTVLSIHVLYTTLKTVDGKIIVIPNSKITSNDIINYSRESCRRNEFIIPVPYETNIDRVIEILKNVMYADPRVLKNRDIIVGLNTLEPYSMHFIVRCWSNTNILKAVYWDLMGKFKKALEENNIQTPYPRFDIHSYTKENEVI
ncbi:Small-conductance mechanosensitive channel [Buchnera aphidicola (Pterocallis alni)]|uniref:small-conductance mechanosensitive channel MscS n=1 Tax=Buchnera aphidicola TaxID=9 RepID=UPI003463D75D